MESNSSFFNAIKDGEFNIVKQMVDQDKSLANAKDENGTSAVLIAIYYSEPAIANLLISQGAQLDIFEATAVGKEEDVRSLLQKDAALVNAFAPDGFQPLGLACFFGHTSIVKLLLEHGADVNSRSKNASSVQPLHSAVAGRHLEISWLLLEHGAEINSAQQDGFMPIHEAAQNGDMEMIKLLIKHKADLSAKKSDGQTAVDIAFEKGYVEAATLIQSAS